MKRAQLFTGVGFILLAGLVATVLVPSLMSGRSSGPGHYLQQSTEPEHHTALVTAYEEEPAREREEHHRLKWAWFGIGIIFGLGLAITGHALFTQTRLYHPPTSDNT